MKKQHFHRNKMHYASSALVLIAMLLVSTSASASGGMLDVTFGSNGAVVTDLGSSSDHGVNIVIQTDGKIIMAGSAQMGSSNPSYRTPVLVRYNSNGSLDTTFGAGGKLTVSIGGFTPYRVARQTDGKLIVAGSINNSFVLARYYSNGTLDTSFGTNGVATATFDELTFWFSDLAIRPDGKILVAGTEQTGTGNFYDYVILRLNNDGSLDQDFGINIYDRIDFPNSRFNYCQAIALQTDGKIVMSGYMMDYDGNGQISLARVNNDAEGTLDAATFGTNGQGTVITPLANFKHGQGALAIQSDGKIVLAGTTYDNFDNLNENLALVRYNSNGTLDATLNESGIVITDFGSNEVGNDLAIQKDGKILVAGQSYSETASDFLLVRYNSNGSLDTSFGDGGKVISDFGSSSDAAMGMALQSDGKILATGVKDGDALLVRYIGNTSSPLTVTFKSKAAQDGWILESTESSNVGGSLNKTATTFNVGDDVKDKQYRSIISFNTATLPDNAIITSAQIKIKRQASVGTDPFTTHGNLLLEIRNGVFSRNLDLVLSDFAAATSSSTPETFSNLTSGWVTAQLSASNLAFVNKVGVTQFRLRFELDDNDDLSADYLKFYTGEAASAYQPQLIITYVLPQ